VVVAPSPTGVNIKIKEIPIRSEFPLTGGAIPRSLKTAGLEKGWRKFEKSRKVK